MTYKFKFGEPFVKPRSPNWGGKRPGAGRPRKHPKEQPPEIQLELNSIQKKVLLEMGDGDLSRGIQKLIEMHL
ncbi:MAG: hypothetical protein EBS38_08780 [Actinobacteria bacterium]|nr:hypothetical protein [Actinomycetota bacterium]